jgi:regulator of RNase E activity RraA
MTTPATPIDHPTMLALKRWNTPTVYNGWEQITRRDASAECFNREETRDFMPQMGPMVGRAVTVVIEPSNIAHKRNNPNNYAHYLKYVASSPGPKIVVVQDLDHPNVVGSFWGEVGSNIGRALGCIGTITDGGVRDLDEMTGAGFKALARRLCVGHAHGFPVRWNCPVKVFGTEVAPGQLIHADKHGFLAVPPEDESALLEAARFMDQLECRTVIPVGAGSAGRGFDDTVSSMLAAGARFGEEAGRRFKRSGEWSASSHEVVQH